MLKEFNQLVQVETRLAQESYDGAGDAFRKVVAELIVILAIALVMSVVMALFMSRIIVLPLRKAIAAAGRIAGGDLAGEIKVVGRDETGELLAALKNMNDSLLRIVGEVRAQRGVPVRGLRGSQRHGAVHEPGVQRTGGQRRGDQRLDRADDRLDHPEHRERQGHRRHGRARRPSRPPKAARR